MKRINSILALLLAAVMVLAFAACNKVEPQTDPGNNTETTDQPAGADATQAAAPEAYSGNTYSTGKFTVAVPEGWSACPAPDFWDSEKIDEYACYLVNKEGVEEMTSDLLYVGDTLYIKVEYTESDGLFFEPDKSYYDDAEDVSVTANGSEWTGFKGNFITPSLIIWTENADGSHVKATFTNFEADVLSNPDVLTILGNITK